MFLHIGVTSMVQRCLLRSNHGKEFSRGTFALAMSMYYFARRATDRNFPTVRKSIPVPGKHPGGLQAVYAIMPVGTLFFICPTGQT
jgi:hypothetical protein